VHGPTSVEQGAPGSLKLPWSTRSAAEAIVGTKGLLFGFEGPSQARFFDTLDADNRVLPLCAASLSGPIAQLARARA
jgi:hypothetical protein